MHLTQLASLATTAFLAASLPTPSSAYVPSSRSALASRRRRSPLVSPPSARRASAAEASLRDDAGDVANTATPRSPSVIETYFAAFNDRDYDAALACFAEDVSYHDTIFPDPFVGKEAMREHLAKTALRLPDSFVFVVDDLAVERDPGTGREVKVGTRWHVESDGKDLPFARGASFYTVDPASGLIASGFDVPEPAVVKPGYSTLTLLAVASQVVTEPARAVPWLVWGAYMYVVFFSDGILPGANALALEPRTWEEVRDLSLNFFLVSPALHLPFSPVVHPMLEGIFNLLLSWAALFAGFLSDDREDKPNVLPMLPAVAGMQFLTSAFLLPYLATRFPEEGGPTYREDLPPVHGALGESRLLGPVLGGVGAASIYWGLFARPEFGDFATRYASLGELLSIDRVGSSFVVDLVIFGLFQGWLVDDDLRRRGVEEGDMGALKFVAKYIPFFGLVAYLVGRPALPSRKELD